MHSSVIFLFVLSLVMAVFAEENSKGPRHRGPRKHPGVILFPACESLIYAMEKSADGLYNAEEIGHRACKEKEEEVCIQTDAMKVRCADPVKPSEECIQQLTDFMLGNSCNE